MENDLEADRVEALSALVGKANAKRLIAEFNSLNTIGLQSDEMLLDLVPSMDARKIRLLRAAFKFPNILVDEKIHYHPVYPGTEYITDFLREKFRFANAEKLYVLHIGSHNTLIGGYFHSSGDPDRTPVFKKDIIRRALNAGADSIILSHNHPHGLTRPSKADIIGTREMFNACKAVGLRLDDHIIFGKPRKNSEGKNADYCSMEKRGYFSDFQAD